MYTYVVIAKIYMILIILEKSILKKISRKTWSYLLLFPLFFMTTFRNFSVGSDTIEYYGIYNVLSQQPLFTGTNFGLEVGYVFLNRIFGILGINFFIYQILYSIFIYVILSKFITKYSTNIAFSIFFFITYRMFFFSMTGIRQMIAIAILLTSISSIQRRQFIKFCIIVTIACLFHTTSIFFVLLYFVPFSNLNIKSIFRLISISTIIFIGGEFLVNKFAVVFPKYSNYLQRMEYYDGIFVYIQMIIILLFLLISYLGKNSVADSTIQNDDNENSLIYDKKSYINIDKILLNAAILAFMFSLFSGSINIAGRIVRYFSIFLIIYLPGVIEKINNSKFRLIIYYVSIILMLLYFIITLILRENWDGVIPYKWIWSS